MKTIIFFGDEVYLKIFVKKIKDFSSAEIMYTQKIIIFILLL